MTWRDDFVAECRTYLGTPYRHQGRLKGVGVDCAGVLEGAVLALGLASEDARRAMQRLRTNYDRSPDGTLERLLSTYMDPISPMLREPGDVALMAWGIIPQHVAIFTEPNRVIHAFNRVGGLGKAPNGKVVEVSYSRSLQRITRTIYRFRGLD